MAGFSVKKPLTIFVTVLGIIVLGVVAYLKMTPDLLPNMDFPYVIIVTSDPGASPESIEQSITRPVEQSMATLDKIKTVTSTSQDSVSMVILEFEDGANMDTISVDIQQKISVLQGSWDDTVSAPYVLKINPSMLPVMVAAVSREDMDVYALSDFVTGELSPKLEGVSGVASISVSGAVTREAHVILDEAKLDALSEKLADAVRTELNKTKLDLQKAKDQVEKGQAQLDEAKEAIAAGAAAKAGAAVDKLYEYLKEARGQIPGPDPDPNPGEPPITVPGQEQLKKTLERLNATLDKLMQDLESGELKREVTSEVYDLTLSLIDGITQLTEAQIQLDEAMTQIEAGMDQINEAYKSIADQTDVGGMLSISAVSQLLTAQNFAMPAGYIEDDSGVKYMVSVGENVSSRQELEDMVLLDLGMDGIEPVTLGDIATVVVTDNAGELYTKVNGDNGILITFTKQSNYATAEVSDNITARLEQLTNQYPNISFKPLMDQGDYIHLIVDTIVSAQLPEGGFALGGSDMDVDITAMALQALARYRSRADVSAAVEAGLSCLSQMQEENGAFSSWGTESSESVSQVLTALTELGLSLDDARFVKNGQTLEDVLLRFAQDDGSFAHTPEDGGNLLATTQAFYALTALQRARDGKTSLYDMSDVAP